MAGGGEGHRSKQRQILRPGGSAGGPIWDPSSNGQEGEWEEKQERDSRPPNGRRRVWRWRIAFPPRQTGNATMARSAPSARLPVSHCRQPAGAVGAGASQCWRCMHRGVLGAWCLVPGAWCLGRSLTGLARASSWGSGPPLVPPAASRTRTTPCWSVGARRLPFHRPHSCFSSPFPSHSPQSWLAARVLPSAPRLPLHCALRW